jgi:hypothetical protein
MLQTERKRGCDVQILKFAGFVAGQVCIGKPQKCVRRCLAGPQHELVAHRANSNRNDFRLKSAEKYFRLAQARG